ncbi:type II secretion system protein GspG [Synechocystis sp. LKSZ1]|uniref:type IV pilin protein n=1 Tax=Synechocystis sp. LKSZ1 TaxID=3144951 RepID=UPI00336C1397
MLSRSSLHLLIALSYRPSRLRQSGSGFTLLEILIVSVGLGILAALAFPSYMGAVDKAHYAEAKSQMGCLARELQGFRLENGHFPDDVNRNIRPVGINCFYTQASGQVPFDSRYDYDVSPGANCYVQIVFLGKNNEKEAPHAGTRRYPQAGLYDYSEVSSGADDLVYSLGVNPFDLPC